MISGGPLKSKDEVSLERAKITIISCTIGAVTPFYLVCSVLSNRIRQPPRLSTSVSESAVASHFHKDFRSSYARNFCTATSPFLSSPILAWRAFSLFLSPARFFPLPLWPPPFRPLEISPFTFERGVTRDTIARFEHEGQNLAVRACQRETIARFCSLERVPCESTSRTEFSSGFPLWETFCRLPTFVRSLAEPRCIDR